MSGLSHLDDTGAARMVDVSDKDETQREAVASGSINLCADALIAVTGGTAAKGDVLAAARIAGIMAAKNTSSLIPLCHPLPLTNAVLTFDIASDRIIATATVRTTGKTGVEMEALTAVSIALLTIYDMVKSLDKAMTIDAIRLLSKRGGKSGDWIRDDQAEKA